MASVSTRRSQKTRYFLLPLLLVLLAGGGATFAQSVTLQWDPNSESNLAGYNLYRSTTSGSGYVKLNGGLITRARYADSTINYDKTYYYVCTAVNTSGLESGYSNQVSFSIPAPNSPPVAADDTATTPQGQAVTVNVTANDTDPDGDALTVTSVTQPAGGSAAIVSASSVRYTPNSGFHGTDAFNYTISDGRGGTASATVTVTVVAAPNQPPTANPVTATTEQGQAVTVNVTINDSDPDGDPLTVTAVTQPANGSAAIVSASSVRYTPAAGFHGTDGFNYTISDGHGGTATASVTVTVLQLEEVAGIRAMMLPVTVDTGADYLSNTYVGVGLVNPTEEAEIIGLGGLDRTGRRILETRLIDPLAPRGQAAFLTSEVDGMTDEAVTLSVEAPAGSVQGFFMVGDYNSRRMDGVGAALEADIELYFPVVNQGADDSTLIQMLNRSADRPAAITLELRRPNGALIQRVEAAVSPSGSFLGTVAEIFSRGANVEEGFVKVVSDVPVSGYQVVANARSLVSGAGRNPSPARRWVAPHFFLDQSGGTSILRLLNTGTSTARGSVRVFDDLGRLVAQSPVDVPAGRLSILRAEQMLTQPISGFLEVEIADGASASLLGSVTYSGFGGRSATQAPLLDEGRLDTLFPQVAQTSDGSIFTGLAVLNTANRRVTVTVEAYNTRGQLVRSREFSLQRTSRRIGLLRSAAFLGEDFEQVKGSLRVRADGPVASCAIFGDARGEFLSTIEGQPAIGRE
jgi:fibronectin type 3 domain-containing protein